MITVTYKAQHAPRGQLRRFVKKLYDSENFMWFEHESFDPLRPYAHGTCAYEDLPKRVADEAIQERDKYPSLVEWGY